MSTPDYPRWTRALEVLALGAFSVLAGSFALSLILDRNLSLAAAVATVGLGFFAADLISGLVHFWCDHVGRVETPFVGPVFVRHFLAHHADPESIAGHDFVETNGNNFLGSTVLLLPSWYWWAYEGAAPAAALFALSTCFFLALTNQSHKWAHLEPSQVPGWVRWAQRRGLLLCPQAHARHHRGRFDESFCITSGALNPLLDRAGVFPILVRLWGGRKGGQGGPSDVL